MCSPKGDRQTGSKLKFFPRDLGWKRNNCSGVHNALFRKRSRAAQRNDGGADHEVLHPVPERDQHSGYL
jgi:hypothetical protein